MWILSCDSDLFDGKRLWLRPGSTHLFGRTSGHPENGERIRFISEKSVSRKHLLIRVSTVGASDVTSIHKRTGISLEDNSKVGTTINGESFVKKVKTLDGSKKEYVIRLGHMAAVFKLVWEPVTLTFTSLGKKGITAELKSKLEGTGVKLLTDYVTNETTHVIGKKRNIPYGLQALVQGRWLVTYDWVDALAAVTKKESSDADNAFEEDFDAHWPKEEGYIVPAAQEPHPRPTELLKPKPERAEVFQDFLFIFLTQKQYDDLMPVITSGGGKALLWEVAIGASSVEELVDYVREVAGGKKGNGQFRLSQHTGRGGVVVVRTLEKSEEWIKKFLKDMDRALDQASIEQSAFLDPILTLETSELRRQLPESESKPSGSVQPPASAPRSQRSRQERAEPDAMQEDARGEQAPTSAQPELEEPPAEQPAPTTKRRNRRPIQQSRYKDLDDDDFQTSQYTRRAPPSPEPSMREASQAPSLQDMDVDEPSQSPRARTQQTQQSTRKRPAPVEEEPEEEEDIYESMLPGQAALKRRKTAAAQSGVTSSFSKAALEAERAAVEKEAKAKKRKERQIDVQAELKAHRVKEDEQRRKDEEILRKQMEGVDIADLKNLAQIEEMEVPVRERPVRRAEEGRHGERWDPAWNGRKNFKKFRPQGQRRDVLRLQRVIVTLEEVPRKGHGIGDEYWLSSTAASGKSKSKSQSQSQSVHVGATNDEDDDATTFRRRIQKSREEDAEAAADDAVQFAGNGRERGLGAHVNGTMSQTLGTESQRKAAGKRPAAQQGGRPAKKARQTTLAPARNTSVINLDDDDEDDALKFRRRRR